MRGVRNPIPLLAGFAGLQNHDGRRVAVFQEAVLAVGLDFDAGSGRDLKAIRNLVAVGTQRAGYDLHPDRADHLEDAGGHFGVADAGVDRPHEDVAHDQQGPVGIPRVFLGEGIAVTAVAHGDRHRIARGRLAFEIEIRARREESDRAGRGNDLGIAGPVIGTVDPLDERVAHLLGTLVARRGVPVLAAVDHDAPFGAFLGELPVLGVVVVRIVVAGPVGHGHGHRPLRHSGRVNGHGGAQVIRVATLVSGEESRTGPYGLVGTGRGYEHISIRGGATDVRAVAGSLQIPRHLEVDLLRGDHQQWRGLPVREHLHPAQAGGELEAFRHRLGHVQRDSFRDLCQILAVNRRDSARREVPGVRPARQARTRCRSVEFGAGVAQLHLDPIALRPLPLGGQARSVAHLAPGQGRTGDLVGRGRVRREADREPQAVALGTGVPMHQLEGLDLVDLALDNDLGVFGVVHDVIQAVDRTLGNVSFLHGEGVLATVDVQNRRVAGARLAPESDRARGVPPDAQFPMRGDRKVGIGVDEVDDLVPDILAGLALDRRVKRLDAIDGDLDLFAAGQDRWQLRLVLRGVGQIDRQGLVELQVPPAADGDSGRVADAVQIDPVLARSEDQDASGERVRDVEVLPVIGQRGRRPHAARTLRLRQLDEIRLADDDVRGRRVRGRHGVVHQDAVVASIGHEQHPIHDQSESREIQGALAPLRIARHVGIDLLALRRERDCQGNIRRRGLVLAPGAVVVQRAQRGAQVRAVVRQALREVGLADHHVRRGLVLGRHRVVDQDAVEAEIGDEHLAARDRDRDRLQQTLRVRVVDALRQIRLMPRVHVGLADHEIRGLSVRSRDRVPDQDAAVLRVGDEELAARQPDTLRPAHAGGGRGRCARREVRLPEHDGRFRAVDRGNRVPEQDAVVVRVGDGNPHAVAVDGRGVVETGNFRQVGRRRRVEVRLAQNGVGPADAGGTLAVLRKDFLGRGHEARDAVVDEHPVVHRTRAQAVAVGDEESIPRERDTLGGAQHLAAGDRILAGEAVLADDETGAVIRHPDRRAEGTWSDCSEDRQ